jgi:hypothetical protein
LIGILQESAHDDDAHRRLAHAFRAGGEQSVLDRIDEFVFRQVALPGPGPSP